MCDDRDREDRLSAFDTSALLRVADDLDEMREHLDGDGYKPPEMRDDILRLHQLAMRVVKEGSTAPAIVDEMFELATDLESCIDDLSDALDRMRHTIGGLAMLAPDE